MPSTVYPRSKLWFYLISEQLKCSCRWSLSLLKYKSMHKSILAYGKDWKKKLNALNKQLYSWPSSFFVFVCFPVCLFVCVPDRLPDCIYFSASGTSEDVSNNIDFQIWNFITKLLSLFKINFRQMNIFSLPHLSRPLIQSACC